MDKQERGEGPRGWITKIIIILVLILKNWISQELGGGLAKLITNYIYIKTLFEDVFAYLDTYILGSIY